MNVTSYKNIKEPFLTERFGRLPFRLLPIERGSFPIKQFLLLSAFLCCSAIVSQTTNTGQATIMLDTKVSTVEDFMNLEEGDVINDGEFFIYRNFHNDGSVDFVEGGLTRFVGFEDTQLFTGTERSYFYNALFNNNTSTVPFQLYSTISVANESTFEDGVVDNDDYGGLFIFEQDGFHTGTSDMSHVDGHVLKEGSTEFQYPIGDGGYFRFAEISAPEAESDVFKGKYIWQNPDELYPLDQKQPHIEIIDNNEYWTIERDLGTSEVLVTLSWRDETTPAEIIAEPQDDNIHIVRWDESIQLWVDEGGAIDINNQTVTTTVTGYGVFTLARVENETIVLPCGLEVYNAVSANNNGQNDAFTIDGIGTECADNVTVQIFNRWGVKVYEATDYGQGDDKMFKGYSEGRITIKQGEKLPTGTYFYILEFDYANENGGNERYKDAGYLYLTSDDQ